MHDNSMLKLVYTFFLGIMLALFVGIGINTFYSAPSQPKYPVELNNAGKELTQSERAIETNFSRQMDNYNEKMKPYNRNVSIIAMVSAVILLVVSILFENKIKVISDGVMLGGLFTLLYSVGRGFASQNSKYMFAVISLGLAVALYLGYHRFVRSSESGAE